MAESPVVVVATLIAKEGQEDFLEKTLRTAIAAVHAEPGCLKYSLHRKAGTTGHFVMIEKWASAEALGVHGKAAALREAGPALQQALAGALDVQVFDPVPAGTDEQGAI